MDVQCSHDGFWCGEEFDSREVAIDAGKQALQAGIDESGRVIDCFYVGVIVEPNLVPVDFGGLIQDALDEEHFETGGEHFDGFAFKRDHLEELGKEVQAVVEKWMKRHEYTPGYFLIRETEKVDL